MAHALPNTNEWTKEGVHKRPSAYKEIIMKALLIPIIAIGFASFGVSVSYAVDTRQVVYEAKALLWTKVGVLYSGD